MRRLVRYGIRILREEGLTPFLSKFLKFLKSYLYAPVALISLFATGRSFSEAMLVLPLGKPLDRVDALLDPPFNPTPPMVKDTVKANHISRYLFAIDLFDKYDVGPEHLDVACGVGYANKIFRTLRPGTNYLGVEIDSAAINYANAHYGNEANYVRGNAAHLPLKENSRDSVSCFETLEHVNDDKKLLNELRRVVSDDGCIIVSVPNNQDLSRMDTKEQLKDYPHVNSYDARSFERLLNDVFEDSAIDTYIQQKVVQNPQRIEDSRAQTPYGFYRKDSGDCSEETGVLIGVVRGL
ncbi:class I SAM-dependent methyltransferase [Halobaculum gomorrense]|uniref:Methyltransferase domain-containing protein n=1 Tax=Halobaculum gomorrense TaxID=43928 RepID=A0A1M5JAX9_9EURY|nr:class I SAM-dependent methyltransferase [Halobaculum gomorrense]SHG37722.1 Methyltransferase domain-containing protein [Halobaculum gomorrense]